MAMPNGWSTIEANMVLEKIKQTFIPKNSNGIKVVEKTCEEWLSLCETDISFKAAMVKYDASKKKSKGRPKGSKGKQTFKQAVKDATVTGGGVVVVD